MKSFPFIGPSLQARRQLQLAVEIILCRYIHLMPKSKMIAKACPKCDQQVPVACKSCSCGHSFFNARRSTARVNSPGEEENSRRRTQRVRREKPNYYDPLEYDKVPKKKTRSSECDDDDSKQDSGTSGKAKRRKVKQETNEDSNSATINITAQKQETYALVLAEINRKLLSVTWKPEHLAV